MTHYAQNSDNFGASIYGCRTLKLVLEKKITIIIHCFICVYRLPGIVTLHLCVITSKSINEQFKICIYRRKSAHTNINLTHL